MDVVLIFFFVNWQRLTFPFGFLKEGSFLGFSQDVDIDPSALFKSVLLNERAPPVSLERTL